MLASLWVGGAVITQLLAHQGHSTIKTEYEEVEPSAVHRKYLRTSAHRACAGGLLLCAHHRCQG
jgi:hypothetical protein